MTVLAPDSSPRDPRAADRSPYAVTQQGVVITGASRGLGAALAFELARRGARLGLIARTRDELERVVTGIRATGGEAHALVGDVADKEAIYRLAGSAQALLGNVSVLVSNASTLGPVPLRL